MGGSRKVGVGGGERRGRKKWLKESKNSVWWLRVGEKTAVCHVAVEGG